MDRVSGASDPNSESDDSRPTNGGPALANITFDQLCKVALILMFIEVFGAGAVTSLMLG